LFKMMGMLDWFMMISKYKDSVEKLVQLFVRPINQIVVLICYASQMMS